MAENTVLTGAKRCKAHNRQGEQCGMPAVRGREVCHFHGGASPRGAAHPHYKDGRYSKDLPTQLEARYRESMEDPDLISLRDEIALVSSRTGELLEFIEAAGPASATWAELHKAWTLFKAAEEDRDVAGVRLAVRRMGEAIENGYESAVAWSEVLKLLESRRKLVDTEVKRLVAAQQVITADQVILLVGMLVATIRESLDRHIPDDSANKRVLSDIQTAVERQILVGGKPSSSARAT